MNYWEQRELELQRKENAWRDNLHPFMKMIDDPSSYIGILLVGGVLSLGIGLVIGLIIGFMV